MNLKSIRSFINAVGVFVYIVMVVLLLSNANSFFGNPSKFFAPIFMLLLFVVSASITGLLVLGKPVLLFLDGSKKEATQLLLATILWLVIFLSVFVIATILI